jgi:antirestriction protein ArdC/phage/plasmid primase-like uncharacterized protein/ribosomal protein S18 acetylase RimI-like enzyme
MQYLEYFNKNKTHKIKIAIAKRKDLTLWQKEAMPHEESQASSWNWNRINKLGSMANTFLKQNTEIVTLSKNDTLVGMMLIAKDFEAMVEYGSKEKTNFIWFFQGGPKGYLEEKGIDKKEFDISIGAALLDTAVVKSFENGTEGRLLLHADPGGGDGLLKYYEKQGFKRIEDKNIKKISPKRDNDGRYFYMNTARALNYFHKNRLAIGQPHTRGFEVSKSIIENSTPLLIDQNKTKRTNTMDGRQKLPYHERIAKEIIEALEKGTAPWVKPWKGEDLRRMSPFNPTTGKEYEGINFVNLSMQTMRTGDPRWMTYKQAKTLGGQVRKGEGGTTIQYWKFAEQIDKKDPQGKKIIGSDGKPEKETVKLENPKVFYATVFNGSQIDNLPTLQKDLNEKEKLTDFAPNEVADKILINSGADINHKDGNRAFYSPGKDEITLPHKEQFKSEAGYYATALHELGHWTGHESRLDRDLTNSFGSIGYAKEELRAEIGSFMLSSKLGIDFDPSNHNAYIDGWVQILEDTPKEIFKACSDAGKIVNFVSDLQHEQVVTKNHTEQLTRETIDLGFSFTPVDMDKAEALTNGTNWDNWEQDFSIESILYNKSAWLGEDPSSDEKEFILDDIQLYAEAMNDEALSTKIDDIKKHDLTAHFQPLEEHFDRLVTLSDENKPYKNFVSKVEVSNGINVANSHVQDQVLKQYDKRESEVIDIVIEYISQDYPKDNEYISEAVNERYQTNFSEADINSIYNIYEEWTKERTAENDPELIMSDVKKMEDKYMQEHKIPDKPFTASAEKLLNKLVNSKMDIAKVNPTDAKELIELYGSIQEQSPYGSTHTELDFGNAGKVILIQRDDNGDVHTSAAPRENWNDDFFTNEEMNEVSGSKIVEDRNEMKSLERNYLLLEVREQLNNGMRGENLADYIKPIAMSTTTPIVEISKTIDWTLSTIKARGGENEQIGKTLNNLENILEEVYETRATLGPKLNKLRNNEPIVLKDKQTLQGTSLIKNDGSIEELSTTEAIELLKKDFLKQDKSTHTIYNRFKNYILDLNDRNPDIESEEPNLDHVISDMDNIFDDLMDDVLDEEANIDTKIEMEETLQDIRNAAIHGQSEMIKGNVSEHTIAVISNTVDLLKLTADKVEAELSKEPNYSKQIIENDKKLKERDQAMNTKIKTDTFTEKTYLAVPFKQKDLAKKAGAKWDKEKKAWFAPVGANKENLRDWRIENKEIKQILDTPNTSQDPVNEFKEALEAQGLMIDGDPIMDGELRRVKVTGDKGNQKSGAYVGYSDGVPAGWIQNYKTNYKENWKSTNGEFSNGLSAEKIAEQKAIVEAKRAERTKELEELHDKVSETVSTEFAEAPEAKDTHPYLAAKGVKSHGLRLDKKNNLIMPLKDITGKHWTSQKINSNFKGFEKGGKKESNFHIIGADNINELKEIIIVEGYATGASIYEAIGTPVVVAVDSGNLKPVAEAIREKYPDKPILFAGDNDIQKELEGKDNVGKLKSSEAAKDVKAFAIIPSFTNDEIKAGSTDYNDLSKSRGPKEVKKQINIALAKAKTQSQVTKQTQTKTQNLDQNKKNQREVVRKQNHGMSR